MRICTRSWPWLTACCQSSSIRDSLLTQTKSRDNTSAASERGVGGERSSGGAPHPRPLPLTPSPKRRGGTRLPPLPVPRRPQQLLKLLLEFRRHPAVVDD